MKAPSDIVQPRLILFCTGAVSVVMGLWHFATRGELVTAATTLATQDELVAQATTRATHDLNGVSMLFAGLVTVAVAWMAVSARLVAGYAGLYGVYYLSYAWILLFARISWQQAVVAAAIATASLFAAGKAWSGRADAGGAGKAK